MTTETVPAEPVSARWAKRARRAAAAASAWATDAGKAIDSFDVICFLALCGLLAGMTLWFGLGPALTIASALLLWLGVAGARGAETDARRERNGRAG